MDRHFRKVTDLAADLVEFARELTTPMIDYRDHFALVRQIAAEVGHVPSAAIDAWQQAGPLRVQRRLAQHLEELARRGLLRVDDPFRAAGHLVSLAAGEVRSRTYHGAFPLPDAEVAAIAVDGVRAFLHGHLP